MPRIKIFALLAIAVILSACRDKKIILSKEKWGECNEKQVYLFTITNSNGMVMKVTNYGGIITSVLTPDKNGKLEDVVLGFDNLNQYVQKNPCFGAIVGRFANRIRNAQFDIEGVTYHLTKNKGSHCLHGGHEFDKVVWEAEMIENEFWKGVRLSYISRNGMNGFPGNLKAYVTYNLTCDNAIRVRFQAETDKSTHVNMTQHSYFNLNACKESIVDHRIKIDADRYAEIDKDLVPTGVLGAIKGTDWDLRGMTAIGDNIHKLNDNGYDFCYVFNKPEHELAKVIKVVEPKSGRTLVVYTTQPSVQFYTGNFISPEITGKYAIQYKPHDAFCLETQHLPDTPNHSNFPSTLLKPGEKYDEIVIYDFGVMD